MNIIKISRIISLMAAIILYLYLSLLHSNKFNNDFNFPDQKPYMDAAFRIKEQNFWYLGDRNRMPIYPYIQAVFYTPEMSYEQFFLQGKILNTFLSLILLFLIYKVVSIQIKGIALLSFIAISSFAFFVLKAAYFQVELLFYTFSFLTFLQFVKTFKNPNLKNGLLSGTLAAIAYLAKATMLLGFTLFLSFLMISAIYYLLRKKSLSFNDLVISAASSLIMFLIVLSPYLLENKKLYGKYFYNINTTYYLWYDSIEIAHTEINSQGETLGFHNLPEDKIPSFKKYKMEHNVNQVVQRVKNGSLRTILFMLWTYSVVPFSFLLLYFMLLVFVGVIHKSKFAHLIKKNFKLFLFFLMYFSIHFFAFSWYGVIDSGPRFMLTLFLPGLFLIILTLEKLKTKKGVNYQTLIHFLALSILFIGLKVSVIPILLSVYTGF